MQTPQKFNGAVALRKPQGGAVGSSGSSGSEAQAWGKVLAAAVDPPGGSWARTLPALFRRFDQNG